MSYLTQDHLGSPRVITNESGTVTSRKDFAAFGEETVTAERSAFAEYDPLDVRQDYTGYEKDEESGLEFAQARYYKPVHGRYTSVDPMTASATIRNPQTFNRYSYVLNSPYKFNDPLGLISESTGACGTRCRNTDGNSGYGAMTAGGIERPFEKEFAAMALGREVAQALETLASANWTEVMGANAKPEEQLAMKAALSTLLEGPNEAARKIASTIVNTRITLDVGSQAEMGTSGQTRVADVSGLNAALAAGEVAVGQAMSFLSITIAREEFSNAVSAPAAIQGNLIHEGQHAITSAEVLHSVSLRSGHPLDQSMMNDEITAKTTSAQYAIDRGGDYLKHAKAAGLVTADGKVNTNAIKDGAEQYRGISVIQQLKDSGVIWRTK